MDDTCQQENWLKMEREDCLSFNLGTILLSPINLKKSLYEKNLMIHITLRIWKQLKSTLKLRNLSLFLPIANNPSFKSSTSDKAFAQWESLGIKKLGDPYEIGTLLSFQELQSKYNLKGSQYFRYLQIWDYMKIHTQDCHSMGPDILDERMNRKSGSNKLISYLYNTLLNVHIPLLEIIRWAWEDKSGLISKDSWEKSLLYIHYCSLNVRHSLMQFKILHRLRYSLSLKWIWSSQMSPLFVINVSSKKQP